MKSAEQSNIDPIELYMDDFRSYGADCIYIKDHTTKRIVPLKLNHGQEILHAIAEKQKAEKGYIRILLLKSRRFGGSTYIEGRFYWLSSLNFNRNTFIVGHEERSTKTLYGMAKLMQERNPIAPATRKSNAQELIFDKEEGTGLKSQYELATARNLSAGRSQGIHYLHDSEEAFWMDAETLLTGLLQCIPDPPAESEVFRESTANGFGNTFQADVFEAYCEGQNPYYEEDGITYAWFNPNSDWILAFIPWFVHERYFKEFESEKKKQEFLERHNAKMFNKENMAWEDTEGKKLQEKYGLTLEQMYWREWAIENKCGGSVDKFRQEYPADVEEAFLSTGTNVFSKQLCDDLTALCKEPILKGDPVDRMGKTKVKPKPFGHLSIWERPHEREQYFLCVDSAGGMKDSQKEAGKEPDPSCIDVYHRKTGKQVAQWHGHIDYDLIADLVELIGNLYNRATACVELNNHGYTVVADLNRKNYPMYCAKPNEPGWSTNKKTKPMMVDDLREMARDGALTIMCKETVSEMRTFIEEAGKYGAASGCHDERVDTAGMASQMMRLIPKIDEKDSSRDKDRPGITNWRDHVSKQQDWDGEYQEIVV